MLGGFLYYITLRLFLNQARTGQSPASDWFLEIAFVYNVSMRVCACVRLCVCVCVCVSVYP